MLHDQLVLKHTAWLKVAEVLNNQHLSWKLQVTQAPQVLQPQRISQKALACAKLGTNSATSQGAQLRDDSK